MVILIGGPGCAGKTMLAKRLVEEYAFSSFSLDHLKMGLVRSGTDYGFTAESNDWVITAKLWPIVRGIVMTAIENGQDLILEGCYLPPDKIAALDESYRKEIVSFYLLFSHDYVIGHYDEILAHRSDVERRLYPEERGPDEMAGEHERWAMVCAGTGAKHFIIDRDYKAELGIVVRWVREQVALLRKRSEA